MNITSVEKQKMVSRFQQHHKDTGSTTVQIAILTERIKKLTHHFEIHKKDHHSRRGLMGMVAKRKKLLNYLRNTEYQKYVQLISDLAIRK